MCIRDNKELMFVDRLTIIVGRRVVSLGSTVIAYPRAALDGFRAATDFTVKLAVQVKDVRN